MYPNASEPHARDSPQRFVTDWTKSWVERNEQVRARALRPYACDVSHYRSGCFAVDWKSLETPVFRAHYVDRLGLPVEIAQPQINQIARP
jgi:hypothetical protein